jgi:hypothetical protein
MPLDIPLPWLRGPDVSGAIQGGASAGNAAARAASEATNESARIALEASNMQQRNQMEAQRLSQAERLAMMENQTRKEIAQQNQLREQQRLAIEQAYRQATLGIAKGRLEEQRAVADAKAKEAAMRIQRERDFGTAIASGMSVMDAYRKFPVPASVINAFTRAQPKPAKEEKSRFFNSKGTIVEIDPNTGEAREVYKPKDTGPSILGAASEQQEQPGIVERAKRLIGLGSTKPAAGKNIPAVGEVRFGYRFKGGDPSVQSNWEPAGGE